MAKRRPITQLPAINRTAALERFFGSTVDQLFQPGKTAAISGFIGRVPSYNNPEIDFYKSEPTAARKKYQLEATMVSQGRDGAINDLLFYDDLIARLSAEGALVSNPNRLFKSEFWSWAPPIDIDKVNNFQRYYWSGDDVPAVTLTLPGMEIPNIVKADGQNRRFKMPGIQPCWRIHETDQRPALDGEGIFPGCPMTKVDGVRNASFTIIDNDTIEFAVAPHAGATVEVYRYGNIGDGSRREYSFPTVMLAGVTHDNSDVHVYIDGREINSFTVVGDKVVLNDAPPLDSLVTVTLFSSLQMVITGRPYFNIENITHDPVANLINGLRVRINDPYTIFFGFDIKPNSTFKWDEHRPNQFLVDGVGVAIHLMDLSTSMIGLEPQYVVIARDDPALSYFSRINRWVQAEALEWFKGDTIERQAVRPICEHLPDMALWNYGRKRAPDADIVYGIAKPFNTNQLGMQDDFGRAPAAGDIVLFGDVGSFALNNKFFVWPAIDDYTDMSQVIIPLLATAQAKDVFLHNDSRREWRFNGLEWIECDAPGLFPVFDLFDNNGISIGDQGEYPQSTFKGSRIFNFKVGEGANEPVLGFPVEYDTYGAIMFENDLYSKSYSYRDGDIIGFHYYLTGLDTYGNQWYKNPGLLPAVGSEKRVVVPLNLQANPNMDTPKVISRNNWFDHFASIVGNQSNFEGDPYTENNWQYTPRDLSRGTFIVQSRSPLLKLMMLMTDNAFDLKKAIKFVEAEYTRYKLKVRRTIEDNMKKGLYIDEMDEDAEIVKILQHIAANKTSEFPFFLSRIGGGQYFIPLTPAALGILPLINPYWVVENGVKFLVGHDGSKTASVDPLTDRLLMAMEQRIFNSREEAVYAPEQRPYVDEFDLISGKYRSADYSRHEVNVIMQASFEDWARANNADYQSNNGYDRANPFTWNFGSLTDRDGEEVPGNWRGIYRWYFDTEMPNLTPWEMLGFSEKPDWWEITYGPAPYKRGNLALWQDIEQGIIRSGPREGVDRRFIRPGIMSVLPVDIVGNLLDPVQARIIEVAPTQQFAAESWVFGDNSPIENLWRRSSSFGYAKALAIFLMRPAQFVEDYWDKGNRVLVHDTQWIDVPTNDRAAHSELMVHGEQYEDGTQKISFGLQNWLVEYMIQHGQPPELLGEVLRGLDVRLAHKMAGFTTRDRLHVDAESFGRIPDENIQVELYESPGIAQDFYSGVIIEHMGPSRWRVIGYNPTDPYFDVSPADRNGRKIVLTGQDERVVNPWLPNVFYKVGMFVLYEGYVYEAVKNHQSMSMFESTYWRQDETGIYEDERLFKYVDSDGTTGRIPYTTQFHTRQDLIDFLYGYQTSLEARGFGFDDGSWDEAVTKFINWSKVRWAGGSFLTVSPGARSITYKATQGYVLNLEGPQATGAIVNRTGHLIDERKTKVDRLDDTMTITASGDDIYGVALRKGEVEHVLVFANRTIFGDIIYDTTLNVRQERLKIHARRTEDWNGRYDAPGFIISEGQIVTNFDKSAEDLRYMFDIELADNTVLRDHARHVIGFENRQYLSNLLLNETQQFELYQGMIQQKGARGALGKIMRSRAVEGNRSLRFMEEWAFRLAEFGAFQPRDYLELSIGQSDMRRQQQVIRLGEEVIKNQPGVLAVPPTDSRWISQPTDFTEIVADDMTKFYGLPNAGYVRTSEATYMAPTLAGNALNAIDMLKQGGTFAAGETIWSYTGDDGRWSIKYLVDAVNAVDSELSEINSEGYRVVKTGAWTHLNDAPTIPPNNLPSGGIDTGNLGDSGSHFIPTDPATAKAMVGTDTAVFVIGDNSKTFPGTYLYSPRFAVVPGETFVAGMRINVSQGFNGVAYLAVHWFKADGSRSDTTHTYTPFRDHRDTAGASYYQREDISPFEIVVPADAAFAKLRLTVEFSNFTANTVPAKGQAILGLPYFRRKDGNRTIRVDNHNTNGEVTGTRFWMEHAHGLSVGDLVVVSGVVGTMFDASGIQVVADVGPDWFEIDTEDNNSPAFDYELAEEIGPQVFKLIDGRFRTKVEALGFPIKDANLYIDDPVSLTWVEDADHSHDRWAVYSYIDPVTRAGTIVREQPEYMDATRVASSLIYDQNTRISDTAIAPQPVTLARITPIDPMTGVIVGAADKEIDYKLEYDPADYGEDAATVWTDDYVGRLWWDMSTSWFINPYTDVLDDSPPWFLDLGNHIDILAIDNKTNEEYLLQPYSNRYLNELRYRVINWSRLAPGASVDIYEWTKSYIAPEKTGFDLHPSAAYVETVEYVGSLGKEVAVYFFWVKNPTSVSYNEIGRTLDAKSCSQMIADPSAAGVPWMAVISEKEMILSGVRDELTDDSTVLQLQIQLTDEDEAVPHTQWLMLRPEDEKSQATFTLWRKMRDSLTGFDDNLAARPNKALHVSARTGIEEKQSMFDKDKKTLARNSFVTMLNYQLQRRNIGATQAFGPNALNFETPVQEYLIWTIPDGSRTIANLPPEALYSKDADGRPLRTNDPAQMDEWFRDAPLYTRVLLDNRFSDKPSWSVWEKVPRGWFPPIEQPNTFAALDFEGGEGGFEIVLAKHYHHVVPDLDAFADLVESGQVYQGEYVLIVNNADFDGFWTVVQFKGGTPPPDPEVPELPPIDIPM